MAEKEKWPKVIQEAYVAWDMMRRLGFPASDLFFETCSEGHVAMTLHPGRDMTQEKAFVITCGRREMSHEMLFATWQKFIADLGTDKVTDEELKGFYEKSDTATRGVELCAKLLDRGIRAPAMGN